MTEKEGFTGQFNAKKKKNVKKRAVLLLSVKLTGFRQATSGNQEAFCLIMEQLQG